MRFMPLHDRQSCEEDAMLASMMPPGRERSKDPCGMCTVRGPLPACFIQEGLLLDDDGSYHPVQPRPALPAACYALLCSALLCSD